jgi:hypothetical protein
MWGGTLVLGEGYDYGFEGFLGARLHRHLATLGRSAPVWCSPVLK